MATVMVTETAVPLHPDQRSPSTRPIDHRWDRSRGITFGNARRATASDNTWSQSDVVVFGETPASRRWYPSRSFGGSRVPPGPKAPSSPQPYDSLRGGSLIKSSVKESENWKQKYQSLERDTQHLQTRMALLEKDSVQSDLAKNQRIAELSDRITDLQRSSQDQTQKHEAELARIEAESSPQRTQNEAILEAAQKEGADRATEIMQSQIHSLQMKLDSISMDAKMLRAQQSQSQQSLDKALKAGAEQLRARDHELSALRAQKDGETSQLKVQNETLQIELDGRKRRRVFERSDYGAYRQVYTKLEGQFRDLLRGVHMIRSRLDTEITIWTRSMHTFRNSDTLHLFRHAYPGLNETISAFPESKIEQLKAIKHTLVEWEASMLNVRERLQTSFHSSRLLSAHLYFRDSTSSYRRAQMAMLYAIINPLREHRWPLNVRIQELRRTLRAGKGTAADRIELQKSMARRGVLHLYIEFGEKIRSLSSLEALLDDSLVEQATFLQCDKIRSEIVQLEIAWDLYNGARQPSDKQSSQVLEVLKTEEHAYHDNNALIDRDFRRYETASRERIALGQILGKSGHAEEGQFDAEIRERISATRRKADAALNEICRLKVVGPSKMTDRLQDEVKPSPSDKQSSRRRPMRSSADGRGLNFKATAARESRHYPTWALPTRHMHVDIDHDRHRTDVQLMPLYSSTDSPLSPSVGASHEPTRSLLPSCENLTSTNRRMTELLVTRDTHSDTAYAGNDQFSASSTHSESVWSDMTSPVSQRLSSSDDDESYSSETAANEEAQVELSYKISAKDLRDAYQSSPQSQSAFWSYKLYKNPQGAIPKVYYCTTFEQSEERAKLFLHEKVLGFDLEWERFAKQGIKKCVSLIQIASEDKIALFQVGLFPGTTIEELMPPTLKYILQDSNIVKTGVNIKGDATRMTNHLGVNMEGLFELSHLFRLVKYSEKEPKLVNFRTVSLADQVAEVLLLPLKKGDERTSHWSRKLNGQQTEYAASDAYAGFQLYHGLDNQRKLMQPSPPRPAFVELDQPLILGDGTEIKRSKASGKSAAKRVADEGDDDDAEGEEYFDALEYPSDPCETPSTCTAEHAHLVPVQSNPTYPSPPQEVFTQAPSDHKVLPAGETALFPVTDSVNNPSTAREVSSAASRAHTASPEYEAADSWAVDRQGARRKPSTARDGVNKTAVGVSTLRAYHLWHHQGCNLTQVAAICRDPPLALVTVASYVLEAVRVENLPFDSARAREPLDVLPSSVHGRYKAIAQRVRNDREA